jgi:hypothetical protein
MEEPSVVRLREEVSLEWDNSSIFVRGRSTLTALCSLYVSGLKTNSSPTLWDYTRVISKVTSRTWLFLSSAFHGSKMMRRDYLRFGDYADQAKLLLACFTLRLA